MMLKVVHVMFGHSHPRVQIALYFRTFTNTGRVLLMQPIDSGSNNNNHNNITIEGGSSTREIVCWLATLSAAGTQIATGLDSMREMCAMPHMCINFVDKSETTLPGVQKFPMCPASKVATKLAPGLVQSFGVYVDYSNVLV